jgi:hypothetical protein
MGIALAVALFLASTSSAAPITQLGFAMDASGSIGTTNFNTMKTGLANALNVVPTNGTVEITVVTFASGPATIVSPTVINSAATLLAVQTAINNIVYSGGSTDTAGAITSLTSLLTGSPSFTNPDGSAQIFNIITDGVPNSQALAEAAANAAVLAGIDEIDLEAIGSVNLANMLALARPGPGVLAPPFQPGFVLQVNSFGEFDDAIQSKIRFVLNQNAPEPASMVLWGLGSLGLAWSARRRMKKLAA